MAVSDPEGWRVAGAAAGSRARLPPLRTGEELLLTASQEALGVIVSCT